MNTTIPRESKTVELKEKVPQKNQLIKTCVAFANGAGGEIIIGVKDETREIVGITDNSRDTIFDSIANSIIDSIAPLLMPEIYEKNINDKRIVIIRVYPGNKPPYFIVSEGSKKGVYLRVGSSTRKATDVYIEELYRQQKKINFDEECSDASIEQLDDNLLSRIYGKNYKIEQLLIDKIAIRDTRNPKKVLPTNTGVLLFSNNPELYLPESLIICTEFKGKKGRDIIKSSELKGSIPNLAESALHLVGSWIERDFKVSSRGYLEGRNIIPLEAIREGIINALVHRKYFIPGAIKIALYENRLEIFSPGGFPGLVSLNNIGDGTTFLRNPSIAKIARKFKLIEKLGSGIKLIFDSCRKANLRKPIFNEDGDFVKITFFFEKELSAELTDEEKIIELGSSFHEIRIKDLVERIGFSRNTATRKMNALIEEKVFERRGKGAGTYFLFKRKDDENGN